jgi:hypothetical protein
VCQGQSTAGTNGSERTIWRARERDGSASKTAPRTRLQFPAVEQLVRLRAWMTDTTYNESTNGATSLTNFPYMGENSTFFGYTTTNTKEASYFVVPVNYNDNVSFTSAAQTLNNSM